MKGLTTVHVNTLKIVSTMFNAVNYRPTFKLMCVVPSFSHVNHPTQPTTEIVDPLLNFRTRKKYNYSPSRTKWIRQRYDWWKKLIHWWYRVVNTHATCKEKNNYYWNSTQIAAWYIHWLVWSMYCQAECNIILDNQCCLHKTISRHHRP